jgi:hypothetical protein
MKCDWMGPESDKARLTILVASLLVASVLLSGCSARSWEDEDNSKIGITAKAGYAKVVDEVNRTFNLRSEAIYLYYVKMGGEVTRFGKAKGWHYIMWINNGPNQYQLIQVMIRSNGSKSVDTHEKPENSSTPPNDLGQNWSMDSDAAMKIALKTDKVRDFVEKNTDERVSDMELRLNSGVANWHISWHSMGWDTPSSVDIDIKAS